MRNRLGPLGALWPLGDESGATAMEYGLLAAALVVVIIPVVRLLGTRLVSTFTVVSNAI